MTENEKAATFIGWKPGLRCTTPRKPVDGKEFGDVWCPSCREVFGCGDHDVNCPDMTRPDNYMQALVELAKCGVCPSLEWLDYSEADPIERLGPPFQYWTATIWAKNAAGKGMHIDVESPGGAIVKALVALYDAEHKEEVNVTT